MPKATLIITLCEGGVSISDCSENQHLTDNLCFLCLCHKVPNHNGEVCKDPSRRLHAAQKTTWTVCIAGVLNAHFVHVLKYTGVECACIPIIVVLEEMYLQCASISKDKLEP